jgi:hypothetical protein
MQNELNELRHQVRTLKRVVYVAFGLMLVGGLLAATSLQSVPDVIQAKRFELVNNQGKVRAQIYTLGGAHLDDAVGGARLQMHNKDGLSVIEISSESSSGSLNLFNHKGKNVVSLLTTSAGGNLRVSNNEGKLGAALKARGVGGSLEFRNKDGQGVAAIFARDNGDGRIQLGNNKGEITSTLP